MAHVSTIPDYVQYVLRNNEQTLVNFANDLNKGDIYKKNKIGPFVANVEKFVKNHSKQDVEDSGVRWRHVKEEVSSQAKEWYLIQLHAMNV